MTLRNNISSLSLFSNSLVVGLLLLFQCVSVNASVFQEFIHTYTNTVGVGAIYVDKAGTAWVGTSHGLMQHDDLKRGEIVRLTMPEKLRDPIHLIYGLNNGNMVVITRGMKKYIFNPVTYQVEDIDMNWIRRMGIEAPGPWTINIISDDENEALIETDGKIYTLDFKKATKAKLIRTLDKRAAALSKDNRFYHIVTPTQIISYDYSTGSFQEVENPDVIFAPHILKDDKGNLWLGDRNLYYYSNAKKTWKILKNNIIATEIAKSGSDIYVGTSTSGILHYSDDSEIINELHNNPYDINTPVSDHCQMIYVDKNDNFWVTYSKSDISISSHYYDLTKVHHINKLQHKNIKDDIISILPVRGNAILVGTDGNGLSLIDADSGLSISDTKYPIPDIADAVITSLFIDSKNRLWIGSYRSGLSCMENGQRRLFLPNTSPYSIVEDIDGNIYIGTSGNGLWCISADLKSEPQKIDIGDHAWVQELICNRGRNVLVATAFSALIVDTKDKSSKKLFNMQSETEGSIEDNLGSFFYDSRKLIWTIREDVSKGLNIYDSSNDSIYTIPFLSNIRFKSVIEDDNKNMWLASDNDIYNIVPQYNPADHTYSFRHYVYHIRSNEDTPNRFNYRSVAKLQDGRLIFGGTNGYQIVDPSKYQHLGQMAKTKGTLSGLRINNNCIIPNIPFDGDIILKKDLSNTDKITLTNDKNTLNFFFSPRDYDSPFKLEYYYRIDSSKDEWYPIVGNTIELMNLTPGRYHLGICAMTPEGFMSDEVDGIDIEILSPWYLSIWAYIAYILLLLSVLTVIIYYFMDRQKQKLRVLQAEREVSRQHQLNEMKLRFFTNISHDFRTPLSLIITPLESYLSAHNDSETSRSLKPVLKNAVRLLNLVNQILDFRKLDVTGIPLHLSYGDIVSYVRDICASFNLFSEDTGIELIINSDIKSLNMYFDKDKISKIMMNLLSNAFKYNENSGTVMVHISATENDVFIAVSDTGKGIPDTDKPHIFDRFYQSGNRQHTTMGCGIGLHIVREFVQMHEGSVSVEDNKPSGTKFIVKLPIKSTLYNGEDKQPSEREAALPSNESLEIPAVEERSTVDKPTILLVEDNVDFIDFMDQALSGDYRVLKANNGKEALEVLNHDTVNIIISDVMMDQMDGLELCHAVKSDINISHIPVILLTARTLAEDEMKGLESGADDYVTKPFSMPILRQRINRLLDENRKSQDKFRRIPDIAPSEITITPLDEQFLSETIRIVEENMSNPDFSVEMLSTNLGMHRTHLYKKLSCITGKTPIEFIRLIRLKRAAQYLAQSQLYISEIAYKVGFNTPRLLSKYFKEEYNMTPREYIRSLGIDDKSETTE